MKRIICVLLMVSMVFFAQVSFAETSTDSRMLREDWELVSCFEVPENFEAGLYVYTVKRENIDAGSWRRTFSMKMDKLSKLECYTYGINAGLINRPACFATENVDSMDADTVMKWYTKLCENGWPACFPSVMVMTVDDLRERMKSSCLGAVKFYLPDVFYERGIQLLAGTDWYLYFRAEIDNYPIFPYKVNDEIGQAPIQAILIGRGNDLLFVNIGSAYTILKSDVINSKLITWQDAYKIACDYCAVAQQKNYDMLRSASLDSSTFFDMYLPYFSIEVCNVQPCYYLSGVQLSPGWEVDFRIVISLQNAEALSDTDRHHMLPESVLFSYVIDAISGQIVYE